MANKETISGQLRRLGFSKIINKVKPFINYFGDKSSDGCFGDYWTNIILHVREFKEFSVILVETHEWSTGTGIEMSTQIFVVQKRKVFCSEKDVFRHLTNPKMDCMDRSFNKIGKAIFDGKGFIVQLYCKSSKTDDDFYVPIIEDED